MLTLTWELDMRKRSGNIAYRTFMDKQKLLEFNIATDLSWYSKGITGGETWWFQYDQQKKPSKHAVENPKYTPS